jgi:1-acyl-sn-glycerol-3-phosphate acyltransferase
MWQPPTMELMPGFWAPKPSRFWNAALGPLRRYYLHSYYKISNVIVRGGEHLDCIKPGDGALIAPNHSHDSDPHVMMHVGHSMGRQLYFMAAWQVFLTHHGIDGWVMQRFGAFSVDREGCDRSAIRQATELLTGGQWLVVFPEGEIYHTNERLTPLREGVAFMGVTAQRDFEKSKSGHRVWVVPTCIRYKYDQDITPLLSEAAIRMQDRLMIKGSARQPLHERIIAIGDVLLTIKEKEQLGHAADTSGDLPARLNRLVGHLLTKHETTYFGKTSDDDSVPLRVKVLRRAILEKLAAEKVNPPIPANYQSALDDLHLALQLYSYPGDYVSSRPTVERMAETIEKFEEDLGGVATPKGTRSAIVSFGEPIDVVPVIASRPRAAAVEITGKLEESIRGLMDEGVTG